MPTIARQPCFRTLASFLRSRAAARFAVSAAALPLVLASSRPARASLGGDAATIATDTERMKADHSARAEAKYEVHEMRTSSGIVIRQYVGRDAKVFAVTWRGPFLPDMQQLLGAYF